MRHRGQHGQIQSVAKHEGSPKSSIERDTNERDVTECDDLLPTFEVRK